MRDRNVDSGMVWALLFITHTTRRVSMMTENTLCKEFLIHVSDRVVR